jgi:hypothetical protein
MRQLCPLWTMSPSKFQLEFLRTLTSGGSSQFSCLLFSHSNSVCLNFLVMFVMPFSNYEIAGFETNERPIFCWFNHVRISIRYTEPQFPHKALLKGW